jgi:hypothetical protein
MCCTRSAWKAAKRASVVWQSAQWQPHFTYGHQRISVHTFQIHFLDWLKFGTYSAVQHLWVSWKPTQGRPCFYYGRNRHYMYAYSVKPSIYKAKKVSAISVYCVTRYTICSLVQTPPHFGRTHRLYMYFSSDFVHQNSYKTLCICVGLSLSHTNAPACVSMTACLCVLCYETQTTLIFRQQTVSLAGWCHC